MHSLRKAHDQLPLLRFAIDYVSGTQQPFENIPGIDNDCLSHRIYILRIRGIDIRAAVDQCVNDR